jgi:hypothetical protein
MRRARSFDHLVGNAEQGGRHGEAEHPGGLGVDDQLELGRLHDRQVRRLRALEHATGIDAHLTIGIRQARSEAHQPAGCGEIARKGDRRNRMARRQCGELFAPGIEECIAADHERAGSQLDQGCEDRIEIALGAAARGCGLPPAVLSIGSRQEWDESG